MDYRLLEGTRSNVEGEIDIWRGSLEEAVVTGAIVTVDLIKLGCEIKLLIGCTSAQAAMILRIHSVQSKAAVLMPGSQG
jgi:hypothetical protein